MSALSALQGTVMLAGAGKMGGALLEGWLKAGLPAAQVAVPPRRSRCAIPARRRKCWRCFPRIRLRSIKIRTARWQRSFSR